MDVWFYHAQERPGEPADIAGDRKVKDLTILKAIQRN